MLVSPRARVVELCILDTQERVHDVDQLTIVMRLRTEPTKMSPEADWDESLRAGQARANGKHE